MIHYSTDFETFRRLAAEGDLVPVFRQLLSDTLTPVSAFNQLQWGPCGFLFESVVGGERIGRYSFLGSDPFLRIDAFGSRVVVTRDQKAEEHESADPWNG
jgi:anthranilate synthase component I